jgi:hypothetical protein
MTTTTKIAGEAMTNEQIEALWQSLPIDQVVFARDSDKAARDLRIAFARALLASKGAVPEGFKLVPIEPTKEMIQQACSDHGYPSGDRTVYKRGYQSMLAASPTAPAQPCGDAEQADEAMTDAFARLVAFHAEQLDSNPYCYFELAYTRSTAWMAWITDRPAQGEPGTAAHAKSRKVIVRGQGDTPTEACQDALNALNAARKDSK